MILCALLALVLLGAATLGLSRGPQDGAPMGRVQGVAGEGLDAPTADAGGPGGAGGVSGTVEPPPAGPQATTSAAPPPAAAPPASVPPDRPSPGEDQYDGG